MTIIELLFAIVAVANTVLLGLIWLELRGIRWGEVLRASIRRRWLMRGRDDE